MEIDALIDKGIALARSGELNQALDCFNRALEIEPKNVKALSCKGATLVNLHIPAAGRDTFRRVRRHTTDAERNGRTVD